MLAEPAPEEAGPEVAPEEAAPEEAALLAEFEPEPLAPLPLPEGAPLPDLAALLPLPLG